MAAERCQRLAWTTGDQHTPAPMTKPSKYFDMVRIRAGKPADEEPVRPEIPACQWRGCDKPGKYRAPKGRGRDGEFFAFCAEHVRQYNASYNYFDGMTNSEIEDFQRDAFYGHRPTWKLGENAHSPNVSAKGGRGRKPKSSEPPVAASAQEFHAWRARQARKSAKAPVRRLKPLERKAIETLGLSEAPSKDEIKAQYKLLVKKHHPDANSGDRGSEETLREIIQAYNYLKQVGLV